MARQLPGFDAALLGHLLDAEFKLGGILHQRLQLLSAIEQQLGHVHERNRRSKD